jgi:hypothetical protein
VSPYRQPAPRGFRWADQPIGRAIVTVLAIVSLGLSLFVGYQYVGLIDCLRDTARIDAQRTKAIADVTDHERAADRALLAAPLGSDPVGDLRRRALEARAETDRVRAANPAPAPGAADCR